MYVVAKINTNKNLNLEDFRQQRARFIKTLNESISSAITKKSNTFQSSLKKILPIKGNKRINSGQKIFINLYFFYGFSLQAKYPKKIDTNKDKTDGITYPQIDI